MTFLKNKGGSFRISYIYSIKTLVFQCKLVPYVDVKSSRGSRQKEE